MTDTGRPLQEVVLGTPGETAFDLTWFNYGDTDVHLTIETALAWNMREALDVFLRRLAALRCPECDLIFGAPTRARNLLDLQGMAYAEGWRPSSVHTPDPVRSMLCPGCANSRGLRNDPPEPQTHSVIYGPFPEPAPRYRGERGPELHVDPPVSVWPGGQR